MLRQLKIVILVNVLISLLFLLLNLHLWTSFGVVEMDAFHIVAHEKMDAAFWVDYPNFLFWLFWLSTAVNLYFIVTLQRSKETK